MSVSLVKARSSALWINGARIKCAPRISVVSGAHTVIAVWEVSRRLHVELHVQHVRQNIK